LYGALLCQWEPPPVNDDVPAACARRLCLRYQQHTHPRAEILNRYFRVWLERLEITPARFAALCDALDALAL
jgi:hypothetical protein